MPAIKRVADSDAFLKAAPPQNKRAWRQAFDWGAGPPMTPMWGDIERALNTELNQTWAGKRNSRDSVLAAWPQVEELLRQSQDLLKHMPQ
ncbi:MAG: hypothetical protein HY332_12295 [Chloroflexi bacterium]|nr:hypothetical protein [Chloroflexota bacterium]